VGVWVQASIYKRRAEDMNYGIALLCEGLVELLEHKEMVALFGTPAPSPFASWLAVCCTSDAGRAALGGR
jgi:hypothetical protein